MDTDWPKIKGTHNALEDAEYTNPNYKMGVEFRLNCQKCVPTYEMRRRGYDVEALPAIISENGEDVSENDALAVNDNWRNVFNGVKWEKVTGSGKTDILKKMETWGDDARAEIYVEFAHYNKTHVFAAIRENGVTTFIDPQDGTITEWIFDHVNADKTEIARIDNLVPTHLINYCCEGREKK